MFEFYEPGELIDADLRLVLLEKYPGDPDIGFVPAYKFKMVVGEQETEAGEIQLRVGHTRFLEMFNGHIGYKVTRECRGHKYAARSLKLLLPLMQRHGLNTVWIACDPANVASRRTCELAGARFVEIVDLPENSDLYQRGHRQGCRYRLDVAASSLANNARLRLTPQRQPEKRRAKQARGEDKKTENGPEC